MCTRYIPPDVREIEQFWHVGARTPLHWERELFPLSAGPFVRRARADSGYSRELIVGQWGLIPWFSKTRVPQNSGGRRLSTVNARSEDAASRPAYRDPWQRGQRCIIPAASFDEPNWESGRNVWWRFKRADGSPWAVAGLWNVWTDKETGEQVESYTMLTINADEHPLMRRMHKPDPKLGPDQQDKRSLVLLDPADFDQWLAGTVEEAKRLLKLTAAERFEARPAAPALPGIWTGSSDAG